MFVGGEFYSDERWQVEKPLIPTENMTFLNGGKACLVVIADYLVDQGIDKILLPSYLCSAIVDTLGQRGLTCNYYQINPDFSINLEDLTLKARDYRAVYFINYFGFFHSAMVRDTLSNLRNNGKFVVEDNAQAGFSDVNIGDFVFNSLRKLAPFDGGYLGTPYDVVPYVRKHQGYSNRRLPVIREYRERLAGYLFRDLEIYDELVKLYQQAETYYESDFVVEGDQQERHQIEHLDWPRIKRVRRQNYAYLLDMISSIPELSVVYPVLQDDNMPLGLPVYVNGIARDRLHDELGEIGIGLTVHWHELLTDTRLNRNHTAVDMAGRILTLVIDQQTSLEQLDYQVQGLKECIMKLQHSGGVIMN